MMPSVSHLDDPRVVHSGLLLVELAGVPGAGKTTGAAAVHDALRRDGWVTFDPVAGARTMAYRTFWGRLLMGGPAGAFREALAWRLFLLYRLLGAGRVVVRRPRHFLWLAMQQMRRPEGAMTRGRRVLHWYLRMAGAQEVYRRLGRTGEAVVFDEGHIHRVVQLFSSPVDRGTAPELRRYLEGVPRPDLLIHVECPPATCVARITERGVWQRLEHLSGEALKTFVDNAGRVLDQALVQTRERGWQVFVVGNAHGDVDRFASDMATAVRDALSSATPTPPGNRVHGLAIPRPRQLALLVGGRLGSPSLPAETVDAFLARLGTARRGRVSNLALARRSDSVRVQTGLGPLVIRAYPDHWPEESLRHEHSLLLHLQRVGYPSTRLVPSPEGETALECRGRRIAAHRFQPGRNLSGSFLPPNLAGEACHLAGRLLCRLHRVTTGLQLSHRHHLAMEGEDGKERLASQLAVLEDLAFPPHPYPLAQRAGEIADRLARLHATVSTASIAVIHGDFGLHNLLLRGDGTATVVDFELARRDWCLVDIVETLGSMSEGCGRAFLAGYRRENGGEPDEWRLLAEMWEYHRLAGAVRAWQSYERRGQVERLDVVARRLAEADRVAERGVVAWR